MSLEGAISKRTESLTRVGKIGLNVQFPTEFELYVLAFELIDSNSNTLQYFIFPVNPSSLEQSENFNSNVKKTQNGVVVLSSPNFIPLDISLSGTFGRKFRVLLGSDYKSFINSFKNSLKEGVKDFFDERVKSGYGCCKILEEIIRESNKLDEYGGVKTLILHNLAFGNSYIVIPTNLRFSMSQESNMIWNYQLSLKAIGDRSIFTKAKQQTEQRFRLVLSGFLQSRVDNTLNTITTLL